jgi:hypothetical protein
MPTGSVTPAGGSAFNGGTITNPQEIAPDASDDLSNGYLFLHSPFNEGSADGDPLVYADTHDGSRLFDVRDDGTFIYRGGDGDVAVAFKNQAQTRSFNYSSVSGISLVHGGVQYLGVTPTAVGFYGAQPVAQQTVTGAKLPTDVVMASLLTALAALGLVVDSTT